MSQRRSKPSISSAADWPVPRPPGRSPSCGVPVVLHEMRPDAPHRGAPTDGLAELVCSNSLRSDDRENNAVGLLHEEMRRLELAGDARGRRQPGSRRRRARGRPRRLLGGHHRRRSTAHPLIEIVREEMALPPPEWDSVIVATGPLTSPALAEAIGQTHRRGRARLLRRHRADRASRLHRHGRGLVPVALRQGRPRRLRRRLHQLPDGPRAIRGLRRGARRGRQDLVPGMGKDHALFRRLPADRGDGRARAGDACATAR